jgi:imidazolonepropionase-like amidohydrolase
MAVETLLADRLFDGTGEPAIDKAFIQIEDGRIIAVGKQSELGSAASGATDLGDATLLPGLINMHTHLTCSASTRVLHEAMTDSYEVKMMRAIENARKTILSGVTTIRDCGTLNPIVFGIREASKEELITAPHVWASGEVLTSTGGHCYFFGVECDSIEDIKKAVRAQVKAGADYIKVMATGGGLTPNTNPREAQFGREEMIELVNDSKRIGKRVAAHCHGTPGIVNAIAAEVTTIEHCSFMVEDGVEYDQKLADGIAEKGIYVCPTIGVGQRYRQHAEREGIQLPPGMAETRPKRIENFRRLLDSGVKFVSGNDAGMTFTGFDDFQLDIEMLVEYVGMSNSDAILTATGQAAEAIGTEEFGTLQVGRRADILGVRGNALHDVGALRDLLIVKKSGKTMVNNLPA